jgi:hypothetical protein
VLGLGRNVLMMRDTHLLGPGGGNIAKTTPASIYYQLMGNAVVGCRTYAPTMAASVAPRRRWCDNYETQPKHW